MSLFDEQRTHVDLVQDLLGFVLLNEWILVTIRCGRGCCTRGYEMQCPTCEGVEPEHKLNCRRAAIIREAEAFLAVEDDIRRNKENDAQKIVPDHPA